MSHSYESLEIFNLIFEFLAYLLIYLFIYIFIGEFFTYLYLHLYLNLFYILYLDPLCYFILALFLKDLPFYLSQCLPY